MNDRSKFEKIFFKDSQLLSNQRYQIKYENIYNIEDTTYNSNKVLYLTNIFGKSDIITENDLLSLSLPINELKGNPPTADCPISNLHRCKSTPSGGDSSGKVTLLCEALQIMSKDITGKIDFYINPKAINQYSSDKYSIHWKDLFYSDKDHDKPTFSWY